MSRSPSVGLRSRYLRLRLSQGLRARPTPGRMISRSPRASALFRIFSDLHRMHLWSSANCGCSLSQPIRTPIPTLFKQRLFVSGRDDHLHGTFWACTPREETSCDHRRANYRVPRPRHSLSRKDWRFGSTRGRANGAYCQYGRLYRMIKKKGRRPTSGEEMAIALDRWDEEGGARSGVAFTL